MYVSQESSDETRARLLRVIAAAEFHVYDAPYVFIEQVRGRAPVSVRDGALAIVGDATVWSQFVPAAGTSVPVDAERFAVFSFHFPAGLDNSGFVGWLASTIKRETGAGVLVVCGQNSGRGGIFDYWGCPVAERQAVLGVVEALRSNSV